MMWDGVYQSMEVLRVLGALHVEMPELDVAAFADERMAHQVLGERGGEDDAGGG